MKNIFIVLILIVLLISSCYKSYNFNYNNEIKIITSNNLDFIINNDNDKKIIIDILNNMKDSIGTACPFGNLQIIIIKNNYLYIFLLATDDCPILKYKKIYYHIKHKDNKLLRNILIKHGVDFNKIRL